MRNRPIPKPPICIVQTEGRRKERRSKTTSMMETGGVTRALYPRVGFRVTRPKEACLEVPFNGPLFVRLPWDAGPTRRVPPRWAPSFVGPTRKFHFPNIWFWVAFDCQPALGSWAPLKTWEAMQCFQYYRNKDETG